LSPGSTVTIADATSGNRVTLTIVGMYRQSGPRAQLTSRYAPRIYGDMSAAERLAGGNTQTLLSLAVAPDQLDGDSVVLQRENPSVLVNNLLLVLTMVTAMVVIAGIAVVGNGVTLAMIERGREIALLKAVGFGPGHVLLLVVVEYGLAGLIASAAGVMVIAATLAILSNAVLETPIGLNMAISALLVAASLVVTAATAWLSARRASWARPLAALRSS
jgi:ABC-type antimicrobial peptide transport system permease subunit